MLVCDFVGFSCEVSNNPALFVVPPVAASLPTLVNFLGLSGRVLATFWSSLPPAPTREQASWLLPPQQVQGKAAFPSRPLAVPHPPLTGLTGHLAPGGEG